MVRARSWTALGLLATLLVVACVHPAVALPQRALVLPSVVVLQPASNGTDTTITNLQPVWNFGSDTSLWVGPNATTGGVQRSLLSFTLPSLPPNAIVVNATLGLFETQGSGSLVQARPVTSSWTEGTGGHSWTVQPLTVTETAGIDRTLEPVKITVPFPPNSIANPVSDLRVYLGTQEVPSQISNERFSGGQLVSADVTFDASLAGHGSESFTIVYSTNSTAVPAYRTQTWSSTPIWTSSATGGGASGVTIADIDGDGKLEILFGGTDGYVYCLNNQGGLKWRTQLSTAYSLPFTPQVADLDHSGHDSLVVVTNDPAVVRLDDQGGVVWRYNSTSLLFSGGTLVDVNGDGVLDVLVAGNMRQIIALDGRDGSLIQQYPVGGAGFWPSIVPLNTTGVPAIVFDGYDKNVHAYPPTGPELWASAPTGTSVLENAVGFGDVNGDGLGEVVSADFGNNGDVFALYASNGTVAWSTIAGKGFVSGVTLADLYGDGKLESIMGDIVGTMYAFRGDGTVAWSYSAGAVPPGSVAVADLMNAGSPQLTYIEGTSVVVLNGNGALQHAWTIPANNQNLRSNQAPMTNPALADLTGNGTLNVIVPTGNGIQAFATPGLDHDWRTWGYNLNHTQRAGDGASGTGAPFLVASLGAARVFPATGASWNYRDGFSPWSLPGGDFGTAAASATGAPGWMTWNLTSTVQAWVSGTAANDGVILTEGSEVSGVLHAFVSSDSSLSADRPYLALSYVSVAGGTPPRIVGVIPDMTRAENSPPWSVNLTTFMADDSTPLSSLRWNVTGFDPSVLQITGLNVQGNAVLTFQPQADAWGSNRVVYWLSDPQGRFASQPAWINITHVDQPPTFNPPGVLYVQFNDTYTFDFGPYIADPDTPRSQLTLGSDDPAHAAVSGFEVAFRYPASYLNHWTFVNLTVSDQQLSVSRAVALLVTDHPPPVLVAALPDETMVEGQTLSNVFALGDYFQDPKGDLLTFSSLPSEVNVTIRANGSVDLGARWGWWGNASVTFRATDPTGAFAEDSIVATVLHVDRPPAIGAVPNLVVHFDVPYSFNLDPYLSDPDTPSADLLVNASDPHVLVSGHLLTLLYPASYNNTVNPVTLSVSDGVYAAVRAIWVTVNNDVPPSLLAKMPDVSFLEGTVRKAAYNLTRYFSDPDGSTLFWSSGNRSVLVAIHPNGSVDLAAVPGWHGTERVTFRATDSRGALQEDSVWITVIPIDHAPYFRPVPNQTLNTTAAYLLLSPYMADPDTNVSGLHLVSTNSTHATIIGQGLLLSYSADKSEYVQVVLSDGNLTNETTIFVQVVLPTPGSTIEQVIPPWLYWAPAPLAAAAFATFIVYRWRKLEWAFLVTNDGLLVSSVSRRGPAEIDTDLVTGMLTVIMDFAKRSFSDEKERNLEGLEMGDRRVALVRGDRAFLAVVYRGRTPGRLLPIMHSLLGRIEREHHDALGDIIDMSTLGDVPMLLERLVSRGNLPFVAFGDVGSEA